VTLPFSFRECRIGSHVGGDERIAGEHDLEDVLCAAWRGHFEVDVRRDAAVWIRSGLDGLERIRAARIGAQKQFQPWIAIVALRFDAVVALVIGLIDVERRARNRRIVGTDDNAADRQRLPGLA
jgi:hypothetical protein